MTGAKTNERKAAGFALAKQFPDLAKELRWHAEAILRLVAARRDGVLGEDAALSEFEHYARQLESMAGGEKAVAE